MENINLTAIDENLLDLLNVSTTSSNIDDDFFSTSHRLLDGVTYTFCVIGILLNFLAYGILRRKGTMGVLLIKLILLSDGLVCVFYLLNQIWTDITLTYLLTALVSEYLSRKPVMQYVSNVFRILAVATVSVSNWYIVIMIAHRCVSIYVNPLRSRADRSMWVFIQKKANLWIAFAFCWFFSLLSTSLLLLNHPLVLEVMIFVVPLTLVFIFSLALLVKLRYIQKSQEKGIAVSTLCCVPRSTPNRVHHKTESEDTFAQTRMNTHTCERANSDDIITQLANERETIRTSSNAASEVLPKPVDELSDISRRKTYYRITMTIFSLALSFLILDSLQFLDLLIRIPWRTLMGSVETCQANGTASPVNATNMGKLWTEIQRSGEKQSVLSIIKNTCTLGKTLTNFLILCAHSRHFRSMVTAQVQRTQRLFRLIRYRMRPRLIRPANTRLYRSPLNVLRSPHRYCFGRRKVNWFDKRKKRKPNAGGLRHWTGTSNIPNKVAPPSDVHYVKKSQPRGLFRQKTPDENEGFVVHKLRCSRHRYKPNKSAPQLHNSPSDSCQPIRQPLSCDQGVIYFQPSVNLPPKPPSPPSKKEMAFSFEHSSDIARCLLSSSSGQGPSTDCCGRIREGCETPTSCCSACDCHSESGSCDSNISNFTHPGACRPYCCKCHPAAVHTPNTFG